MKFLATPLASRGEQVSKRISKNQRHTTISKPQTKMCFRDSGIAGWRRIGIVNVHLHLRV